MNQNSEFRIQNSLPPARRGGKVVIPTYTPLKPRKGRVGEAAAGATAGGKRRIEAPRTASLMFRHFGKPSRTDWYYFGIQLRSLLGAGFPMIEALLVAAQSTPRERLRRMLVRFTDHIRQGAPFERAIAMLGDDMPSMLGNMLTIGNRTGRVTELLDRYIRHCQWRIELRSEVIRVVTYPYFCALTGVGIMMARDVIIMSIGGANTGAALLVVARLYLLPIIFGIIAAIVTGKALAHHALRPAVHRVAAHLPFVGGHVRKYALATFFDAFAVALDSGIIAPAAYQLAIRATANQWVGEQLARWERFLRDGEPVAETLRKTGILEKEALHLIAVGEIGASAPSMMRRLAGWYFENIRTTVKLTIRFSSPFYVLAIATGFFLSPTILAGLVFALTLLLVLT